MSIKVITQFFLLTIIATYFAFLNPNEVNVHLTQTFSIHIPLVVFLLGSSLLGALAATLVYWSHGIKKTVETFRLKYFHRRQLQEQESLDELYQKGENAVITGREKKARSLFKKILTKNPDHVNALYSLGLIIRQEGKPEDAQKLHHKAASLAPENIKVLYGLVDSYIETDQVNLGLETLGKIRNLNCSAIAPLYKIRNFYINHNNWEKAHAAHKMILPLLNDTEDLEKEQNKFSEIVYSKGMELYNQGQTESAIAKLKQSLKENDRSLPVYIGLGDMYLETGNSKEAIKTWKLGFDNTGAPVCLQRIRKVYTTQNHAKEIVKMYKNAISSASDPNKETFQLILGIYFLDQNEPQKTIDLFAPEDNHLSVSKRILLMRAYEIRSQKEEAKKNVRQIFKWTRKSILHYKCDACQASFEEWRSYCDRCNAWNSII